MTFSPSARPQKATGTKQHQMSVTHRTLGLHKPGNPRTGPELGERLPSVAAAGKALGGRQPDEMATRHERFVPFEGVYPEKALSMRSFRAVPIARGFTRQQCVPDTVKAEKGSLWTNRD